MNTTVRISGKMHESVEHHLFPGDRKEAVSIALCGTFMNKDHRILTVYKLCHIPYKECYIREEDQLKWSTSVIIPYLKEAMNKGLSILKIHSHPTNFEDFSAIDTQSDIEFFDSIYGWMDNDKIHGSLIMLPGGKLFGRVLLPDFSFNPIDRISLIGDDIIYWDSDEMNDKKEEFSLRTKQTFGPGTTNLLRKLTLGVIGCSGTGSPVIEQLVRLGVGKLILVDPDIIEEKNLNRILNSTKADCIKKRHKVDIFKETIQKIGLGTIIKTYDRNLYDDKNIIQDLIECDTLFGCVDSVDGRHLMNQISTFYLQPLFDLGVKILADGNGGIEQICGTVHYIKPGGSSLKSRGMYTSEELRAAGMYRTDKKEYNRQKKNGYITNVNIEKSGSYKY